MNSSAATVKASTDISKENSELLLDTLKHHFGYESFREGQAKIINSLLQGQDSLVLMAYWWWKIIMLSVTCSTVTRCDHCGLSLDCLDERSS